MIGGWNKQLVPLASKIGRYICSYYGDILVSQAIWPDFASFFRMITANSGAEAAAFPAQHGHEKP